MGKERGPGFIENSAYTLRNVSAGIGLIALFVSLGIAFAAAMAAVVGHGSGEHLKQQRLKQA